MVVVTTQHSWQKGRSRRSRNTCKSGGPFSCLPTCRIIYENNLSSFSLSLLLLDLPCLLAWASSNHFFFLLVWLLASLCASLVCSLSLSLSPPEDSTSSVCLSHKKVYLLGCSVVNVSVKSGTGVRGATDAYVTHPAGWSVGRLVRWYEMYSCTRRAVPKKMKTFATTTNGSGISDRFSSLFLLFVWLFILRGRTTTTTW